MAWISKLWVTLASSLHFPLFPEEPWPQGAQPRPEGCTRTTYTSHRARRPGCVREANPGCCQSDSTGNSGLHGLLLGFSPPPTMQFGFDTKTLFSLMMYSHGWFIRKGEDLGNNVMFWFFPLFTDTPYSFRKLSDKGTPTRWINGKDEGLPLIFL